MVWQARHYGVDRMCRRARISGAWYNSTFHSIWWYTLRRSERNMAQATTERQRAWRYRHRGEPRGNAAMMAQLAALQGRVAQLEAELAVGRNGYAEWAASP